MMRYLRRLIFKYFGGMRNFLIWTAAVVITIYFIDTYILTRDRLEALVLGPKQAELNKGNVVLAATLKVPLPKVPEKVVENKKGETTQKGANKKPPDKPDKQPVVKKTDKPKCGLTDICPAGKYAYYIKSGVGKDVSPHICFDGNYIVSPDKANGHRGINMVVVNDKTHQVVEFRYFDTYVEDSALVRYLKLGVEDNFVIMATSMDEASYNLKDDGKEWMSQYGSSVIKKLKFRDAFVMVGQRGLTHGSAIEKMQHSANREFATPLELSGCLSFPLGRLSKVEVKKPQVEEQTEMKMGEMFANCGIPKGCSIDSFPIHLYTGKGNSDGPKICVNGKYVIANGLNDGGRGFNIVIVNPRKKEVVRVGHFDTYSEDSSNLEIFLEMMKDKEIILAIVHDDASKNMKLHAQKLFETLGSTMIDKLTFRDVWVFAGQKGIDGHTTIEEVETRVGGRGWPTPIDKRQCVATTIKGSKIKPDPLANKNEKRRKFCAKYDGYGDFCEAEHIDDALSSASLTDKGLETHRIFRVPIIVIPGLNHNAVRMQLETVLMQPGIKPDMVMVMYDEKFDESAALAELFTFKTAKLSSSTKYVLQVEKALEKVWEQYPKATHAIVLEEEVILAPDFLIFMAECIDVLDKDKTLVGVSAFNENGYKGVSTNPSLAYRAEVFPGFGFMITKTFYETELKGNMKDCCLRRSWDGWLKDKLDKREMIIPDVSRVYRRPYEGLSEQADFLTELFNRQRTTNLDSKARLTNVESVTAAEYEKELDALLKAGTALDTSNADDCLQGKGLGFYIPETSGKTFVIYFEQRDSSDHEILTKLCTCFKLFNVVGYPARGLHRGMIRFTFKNNNMMFIGSSSPYYKHKPATTLPVRRAQS